MIKKVNSYIHNLQKVKEEDIDLVGIRSFNIAQFFHEKINHPSIVSITSIAFDDFLIAANIAQPIMDILSQVRAYDYQSAKYASGQIANYFLSAKIPDVIENSIVDAYFSILDSSRSQYVELGVSDVIEPEFQVDSAYNFKAVEIANEQHLLEQVKYAWLSLFTPEAIEKRTNSYYKGALSISLYLKSIVRAEISGKVFSIPPITHDEDTLEIWALYGTPNASVDMELVSDMYKFNIKKKKIVQKNIIPQEHMNVRKGKPILGEDPFLLVEISKEWQRKPKMSDKQIQEIAEIALQLEKQLKKPIEVSWSMESGDLFVTDISDLFIPERVETLTLDSEDEFLKQLNVDVYDTSHSEINKIPDPDLNKIEKEINEMLESGDISLNSSQDKDLRLVSVNSKRSVTEYPKWMDAYDLKTNILLDVSNLDMVSLSAIDLFDGSFLDGTELVLNNNQLPEKDTDNTSKKIVADFAAEIAIAAKDSEGEPLIYSFSNILEYEYKLLNYSEREMGFMGDERFIEHPEALAIEVQAIKSAKDDFGKKNISVLFPYVRSLKNLEDLKSIVSSQGLRRSKNTKFYAEIAIPSFVYELETMPDGIVDGFVINYDTLLKLLVYRSQVRKIDHEVVLRLIGKIVEICRKQKYEFMFKLGEIYPDITEELIKFGPDAIMMNQIPTERLVKSLVEAEKSMKKLSVKKKTGLHTTLS